MNESGLACTFTPPSTVSLPASGAAQSFTFPISNSGCQWTATSTTPGFYVQNDGQVRTGSVTGTVTYSASPNTQPVIITGHLNVGGKTVDVKEDGASSDTFFALITAIDEVFTKFVPLKPGDLKIKEKGGGVVTPVVENLPLPNTVPPVGDPAVLKISGLDSNKTYIVTLTLADGVVVTNDLEVSKARPFAVFDVKMDIPSDLREITIKVYDARQRPISGARVIVNPVGIHGETKTNGECNVLVPKDKQLAKTVTVQANGYSFSPDTLPVARFVTFVSDYTSTGKINLKVSSFAPTDNLGEFLNSIKITVNPPLSSPLKITVSGATATWSQSGLEKDREYTFTFKSQKLTFSQDSIKIKDQPDAPAIEASKKR